MLERKPPSAKSADAGELVADLSDSLLKDDLRARLDESRTIRYEEYGERKIIEAELEGVKYSLSKSYGEWTMQSVRSAGAHEYATVTSDSDLRYLEMLNEEDIPHKVKAALLREREVAYEDYGERKVVSVEVDGTRYSFDHSSREYADWGVSYERASGLDSADIRMKLDTEFLETLFSSDINQKVMEALLQGVRSEYDDSVGTEALTVVVDGIKYAFARVDHEYANWAVSRYGEDGSFIGITDIRQSSDVDLLERLDRA